MQAQGHYQISEADELNEYRMMKFNDFDPLLRPSLFVVRPARNALERIWYSSLRPMGAAAIIPPLGALHGRRVFCGSLLNFSAGCEQVMD
jgi:hypothetical protein